MSIQQIVKEVKDIEDLLDALDKEKASSYEEASRISIEKNHLLMVRHFLKTGRFKQAEDLRRNPPKR